MNKSNVTSLIKTLKAGVSKRSPEILTGIGIAGMVTATVLAVKATPKAIKLLDHERRNRSKEHFDEEIGEWVGDAFTKRDIVSITWKCYIPAAVTGAVSIACIIGASSVNARRNAALATAYQLSTTALSEYKEKVIETVGEKKEKVVREAVAKDKLEKKPASKSDIIVTDNGNTLCYDAISGRYFRSDMDSIRKAVNELNRRMISENYISLNDFYSEIGVGCTRLGNELGWNLDDGLIDLDFSSQLTDDGRPCIVVDYCVAPRYDFSKLM